MRLARLVPLLLLLLPEPTLGATAVAETLQYHNRHSSVSGTDLTWAGLFDVPIDSTAATAGSDSCNLGAATVIRIGVTNAIGATAIFRRMNVWWSLGTAWPASYSLDSAVVDFTVQATTSATADTFDVYCMANLPLIEGTGTSIAAFASGPCWKARDWQAGAGADVLWGLTGCNLPAVFPEWSTTIPTTVDRGKYPVAARHVAALTPQFTKIPLNITPIIQAALAGRVPMGIMARARSELGSTVMAFYTKENVVSDTLGPRLRLYGHTTTTGIVSGGGHRRRHPGVQR